MPRRTTHHLLQACTCAALLTVTGCTAEPTVMDTPTITWEDGIEPTSPLESDPWVRSLRAYFTGVSMARNSGDYTISQFTDHATPEQVAESADGYARQGDMPSVYLGPTPFQPLDVHELPDGSAAAVAVCRPEYVQLIHPDYGPGPKGSFPRDERDGHIAVYALVRDPATGRTVLDRKSLRRLFPEEVKERENDPCDGTAVPVGYFDPRPEVPEGPITEPVRAPLPADS